MVLDKPDIPDPALKVLVPRVIEPELFFSDPDPSFQLFADSDPT
jgi:hypothetical protein